MECVGVSIERDLDQGGVESRRRSEEQRAWRRAPKLITTVCCPLDTHPHTLSPLPPSTFDKQPAASDPHQLKQPRQR